jgi:DNA-binding response OmpR family regulator
MLNILIVEDEKKIRELLKIYFLRENYGVTEAENGKIALEKMKEKEFDIVLLDIYMPEMDGFDTCREIRKTSNVPVVIVTALSDDESQLLAYEIGADDFIVKPFKKDILLAKIRRISERTSRNQHSYKFGGLEIDKDGYRVAVDGNEVKFAPKEFEILLYLVESKGMIKSRDDILIHIWGYDSEVFDRVVDNHIKKIRKKLGAYSDYIKTVVSIGYKFEV